MWGDIIITAGPDFDAVGLDAAKAQCRLDDDAADERLAPLLAAAVQHVEKITGRALSAREVSIDCDAWSDLGRLPVAPVQEVLAISYVDADGIVRTLPPAAYRGRLRHTPARVILAPAASWPAIQDGSQISVALRVGYGLSEGELPSPLAPEPLRSAVLLAVQALNDDGTLDAVAPTIEALTVNYQTSLI